MTKREIENKVNHAFTSNVPDVLPDILSRCDKQTDGGIVMSEIKSKKRIFVRAAAAAAALVLVLGGVLGLYFYRVNYAVASVVSIDVNPSIEIKTNKNEKILEVNPLNEDGRIVIGDMSFRGSSLDVTINALIGSMLRNGYLNDISNSVLVSVYGDSSESSSALQEKLTGEIEAILSSYGTFGGAVLSQIISPDSELQTLADTYNISLGKARLIMQVAEQLSQSSLDELAGLTVNELNLMSEVNGILPEDVQSVGSASDKAYIGIDRAKEAAFAHAGVSSESSVSKLEIEMDYEHGVMIYEVSFVYNDYKYNYDIDAVTGEITEAKSNPADDKEKSDNKDKLPDSGTGTDIGTSTAVETAASTTAATSTAAAADTAAETTPAPDVSVNVNTNNDVTTAGNGGNTVTSPNTVSDIGIGGAKEIAFSMAGVPSENDVSRLEVETDYEHGAMVYEISFRYNDYKYEYKIAAADGTIIEAKNGSTDGKEKQTTVTAAAPNADAGSDIGISGAKEIAFARAGVTSENDVSKLEIETDYEHGALIYEISFVYGNYEYEYEIDAATGEIIKSESEPMDNKNKEDKDKKDSEHDDKRAGLDSGEYIGEAAAKEIAFAKAGAASDSTVYDFEMYIEKNTPVYKIKFNANGRHCVCFINAYTGDILKFEMNS